MVKTQVEPRAAGEVEYFHILWRHFMVYEGVDHGKCGRFVSYHNNEISR